MRRLTSFVAVFVMLVMMAPVLACAATPMMNQKEQDCCRQMHGKCGDMAKQGCCRVEVRNDLKQLPVRAMTEAVLPPTTVAVVYLPFLESSAWVGYLGHAREEHPPPGLLIASTTVLRI